MTKDVLLLRVEDDDDLSEPEFVPWDELGKTPPRTYIARYRIIGKMLIYMIYFFKFFQTLLHFSLLVAR